MQVWKDRNTSDCIRNLAGAWDDVAEEHMNGTWKQTLERYVHDYKGLATEEEAVKIDTAKVGTANDFNLGVHEGDAQSSGRWVPRSRLMSSCCSWNRNAEPKRRPEKGNCGRKRRHVPKKTHVAGLAEALAGLDELLDKT